MGDRDGHPLESAIGSVSPQGRHYPSDRARCDEAEFVFGMLWLNPSHDRGVDFLIDDVGAGITWENRENE